MKYCIKTTLTPESQKVYIRFMHNLNESLGKYENIDYKIDYSSNKIGEFSNVYIYTESAFIKDYIQYLLKLSIKEMEETHGDK